jgi:polyisoprenyl-teichoic acid--peptidoglycan teichoic acid transferase
VKKLLIAAALLTVWVTGSVLGSLGSIPAASGQPLMVVGKAHATFEPALTGEDPIFILVLGSDARPGTPVERGLADSIHILGINPADKRATLFGFPRDSMVALSTGGTNKINAAMPQGGPEAMVATVENLTGITLDYYILTGFGGIKAAVDDIGGLEVDVPYPFQGYAINLQPGVQRLDGGETLDFGRTRKTLPRGDFDRSMNQGRIMLGALAQFRAEYSKDPTRLFTWLGAGLRNVQTTLSLDELMDLAFTAQVVKPANVTNLVAMGTTSTVGGVSGVTLSPDNAGLWEDLKADGYILKGDIPAAALSTPPSG